MKKVFASLALAVALAGALVYGFFSHRQHWFPYRQLKAAQRALADPHVARRWNSPPSAAPGLAQRDAVGALMQIPYLSGYNPASDKKGVIVYDAARAFPGWNLVVSAHAPEARLMDMRGAERHKWALDARRAFPTLETDPDNRGYDKFWRRALLLPDGDLLVVWQYIGIMRIDASSRLKWALQNGAHHDAAVGPDGRIYALTRRRKILPRISPDDPVLEDFVTILTPDGRTLKSISLLESFERSDYAPDLVPMASEGDIFHTNTVQVLDGSLAARSPHFREGNVLVSIHALGIVAILDPVAEKIVWALSGQWRAQHRPHLIGNGRLLMFDNFGSMRVGESRVLEVDPFTQQIAWRYGTRPGQTFYSATNGFVQRLPNGNTLVVSSNEGRAFEVTGDEEVVWEYENPFRTGDKDALVATLEQVERLPADLDPSRWAGAAPGR